MPCSSAKPGTADVAELNQYYGKGNNELHCPWIFFLPMVNKLSPSEFPQTELPK